MKFKVLSLLSLFVLAGCANPTITPADPNPTPHDIEEGAGAFTKDGNILSGLSLGSKNNNSGVSLQVNQYIWKSALQTISFMPLTHADSAGGVILSDWIDQQGDENKQVKVNLYILSKKLAPNALDVKVFTRNKKADGTYTSQVLDKATSEALEETILSNARELKINAQAN